MAHPVWQAKFDIFLDTDKPLQKIYLASFKSFSRNLSKLGKLLLLI